MDQSKIDNDNYRYRDCIDSEKGNCPHLVFNKHNVECCGIDNIVQVRWFGCKPVHAFRNKERYA